MNAYFTLWALQLLLQERHELHQPLRCALSATREEPTALMSVHNWTYYVHN